MTVYSLCAPGVGRMPVLVSFPVFESRALPFLYMGNGNGGDVAADAEPCQRQWPNLQSKNAPTTPDKYQSSHSTASYNLQLQLNMNEHITGLNFIQSIFSLP
jgi:hypothetical protein